jgi:tol-pal system protein YbgF
MKKTLYLSALFLLLITALLAAGMHVSFFVPASTAAAAERQDLDYSREGIERVYQRGVKAFRSGDYEMALFWFDVFLDAFPDSTLADNAFYWKGETYYSMKNYAAAAEAFSEVLARFPEGNKAPAAMFKLGLSHIEMGHKDKALGYLKDVLSRYPGTEAARLAERRLKSLGGDG